MKTAYSMAVIGLLVCGSTFAQQGAGRPKGWQGIRGRGVEIGLSEQQVDHTLNACRQRGMSAEETDTLLAAVYTAHEEGLPANNICIKIEEGLAKQVPAERIAAAAQVRLDYLREAGRLVASLRAKSGRGNGQGAGKGYGMGGGGNPDGHGSGSNRGMEGPPHLVENIGMALESGVPVELFEAVFLQVESARMGRIMPAVDAAEALHLAGLIPAQTQRILSGVLKRDLNRHETDRILYEVLDGMASDQDFDSIYAGLWPEEE